MKFKLNEEYIELYKLLKVMDLVESGGMAKALIADGEVTRNGETETRKRAKIRKGDRVRIFNEVIEVE